MAKIDANDVELRIAVEDSFKTVSGDEIWRVMEANSFGDFGPTFNKVARNPFRSDRQNRKGTTVGLDVAGAFQVDLLQAESQDYAPGFFKAAFREKPTAEALAIDEEIDSVDGTTNDAFISDGVAGNSWVTRGFLVGHKIFTTGFTNAENNGLFTVDAVTSTNLETSDGSALVDEASAAIPLTSKGVRGAHIVAVGFQFTADDLDVDISGDFATYTTSSQDLTALGILPGEWIYVGGDSAATQFTNATNNGWKRVRSVSTNAMVVDKSPAGAMVTEVSSGSKTLEIYFGRVIKNESDPTLIVKDSYQIERKLGAPDPGSPSQIQADYLTGCTPNTLQVTYNTEDKIVAEIAFVPGGYETIDAATTLKSDAAEAGSGGAPALADEDAFNTTNDFSVLTLHVVSSSDEAPTELFAELEQMVLTINNNVNPNKALAVLGTCGNSLGKFAVEGTMTGYFEDIASIDAVKDNSDVTLAIVLVKGESGAKTGISMDVPLIALGDGAPDLQLDAKIKLPLSMDGAAGAKVLSTMNHTIMWSYFDYLPDAADTAA